LTGVSFARINSRVGELSYLKPFHWQSDSKSCELSHTARFYILTCEKFGLCVLEWSAMLDTGGKKHPGESWWAREKLRSRKFKISGYHRTIAILKFWETTTPYTFCATTRNLGIGTWRSTKLNC